MDKKELIIIGLLAIVAILVVYHFAWPEKQIVIVEEPAALPVIPEPPSPEGPAQIPQEVPLTELPAEQLPPALPENPQENLGLVFGDGDAVLQQQVPAKENLVPKYVEFQFNKIIIPEYFAYAFIPTKEDRLRTFSGKFGPYFFDYRIYLNVDLCSYLLNTPEMVVCEKIYDLNYIDNFVTFVRGYDTDEYIGNMAMREFGAFFVVKDKNNDVLAKSNVAPIKLVKN